MCLVCENKLYNSSFYIVSVLPWLLLGYFYRNFFPSERMVFLVTLLVQFLLQFLYIAFTAQDIRVSRICPEIEKNGFPPVNSYCIILDGIELEEIRLTYTGCLHFIDCNITRVYCEKLEEFTLENSTVPLIIEQGNTRQVWMLMELLFFEYWN